MNEAEALEVAEAHLVAEGMEPGRCYSVSRIGPEELEALCRGEFSLLPGDPTCVWSVNFAYGEPDTPTRVKSGGDIRVFVNDDTRECGIFYRL